MKKIESRTYVGQPGEHVTVTTRTGGGGQALVSVDGVEIGPNAEFSLPETPGARTRWKVVLSGPRGALCVVTIAVVDLPGGVDEDFLLCQQHEPRPVRMYSAGVASIDAVRSLGMPRRGQKKTVVTRRKSARKTTGRKTASKRTTKKGGRR